MLVVGKTDSFEQGYMAKFELLATQHGVFVKYEKDRAARDVGLHLTKELKSGQRQVTNSLVWFQMKGVMATTLSKEKFAEDGGVSLSMDVEHLRHWFLDKEPTHLVVYVESADTFLVMNLQAYVTKTWGRGILTLDQKTATVKVPASSVLDKQAFAILLRFAVMSSWLKALDVEQKDVEVLYRDADTIHIFGTADERNVECGILWTKWISKMRNELKVCQRPKDFKGAAEDGWEVIRDHWQYGGIQPEESYPYLELSALEEYEPDVFINRWGEEELEEDGESITLKNGDVVFAPNAANEFYPFVFGATLNDYGLKLLEHVRTLVKIGLLELSHHEEGKFGLISIAPWHSREV